MTSRGSVRGKRNTIGRKAASGQRAAGRGAARGRNSGRGKSAAPTDTTFGANQERVDALQKCARLRQHIDSANHLLARVLQQRAALVLAIGQLKREAGLPAIDPARERAMLRRFSAVPGGYSAAALARILRAVLRESRTLVRQQRSRRN